MVLKFTVMLMASSPDVNTAHTSSGPMSSGISVKSHSSDTSATKIGKFTTCVKKLYCKINIIALVCGYGGGEWLGLSPPVDTASGWLSMAFRNVKPSTLCWSVVVDNQPEIYSSSIWVLKNLPQEPQ